MANYTQTVISELKLERKIALDSFKQVTLIKNEKLAEFIFLKFQDGEDVPFSILENIPIGEALLLPVVFGGAIITTKQSSINPNEILYKTKWTPGSTLTMHYHSDCNEVIEVDSGKIKVYLQGSTHILEAGEKIEVAHGILHQVTALCETELSIKFLKVR